MASAGLGLALDLAPSPSLSAYRVPHGSNVTLLNCSSSSVSIGSGRPWWTGASGISWSALGERRSRSPSFCVRAGIRAVETYDASFQLLPEGDNILRNALSSEVFCAQVAEQSMQDTDVKFEFTGELFQPVPWSPTTKFGMPAKFEKYWEDKETYTIINVPPNFMFKAKIFKPSRLCAIYKRVRGSNFSVTEQVTPPG